MHRSSLRRLLPLLALVLARPASAAPREKKFGHEAPAHPGFKSQSEVLPAQTEPPGGAAVDLGAGSTDKVGTIVYYRYKGVDLPLKEYTEYEGTQPFLKIIDGQDVLWVARRADVYRLLDRVLYSQLDTMTGAADDLYERHRFPAAFQAYTEVLDVLSNPQNDLKIPDLEHYPAIKSYLQFRMGQARSWQAHMSWQESERDFELADTADAQALALERDPPKANLAPVFRKEAATHRDEAHRAAAEGLSLTTQARDLLETAARGNDRLWQAFDELGILATERAERAAADGDLPSSEREYRAASELFKKARVTTDAKEIVDANLVACDAALADLAVNRNNYGEALDFLRQAMELTPDSKETPEQPSYQVSFTRFHPARGEAIVITAELQAGIARKYLEIEHERQLSEKRPRLAEAQAEVPLLWKKRGEEILKAKHWGAAVAFFTGLADQYLGQTGTPEAGGAPVPRTPAPADFKDWIRKGLEQSFGARADALMAAAKTAGERGDTFGREELEGKGFALLAMALQYVENSRVLNQLKVEQALRHADDAIAGGRWKEALPFLDDVNKVYGAYAGNDAQKQKTRADISARYGAVYVGLTNSALARGDLSGAGGWADKAYHLDPPRLEWKANKARVLLAMARAAEQNGDKRVALDAYQAAMQIGSGVQTVRAMFSADAIQAQLWVPQAKVAALSAGREWGGPFALGMGALFGLVYVVRSGGAAMSRRSTARRARRAAQKAYDAKKWNEAIDLFNDYLQQNLGSADPVVYELIARAYRKIGEYDSALRFFERASNRLPGRRYNLERAEIYLMRRNLPLAIQALRTSPNLTADAERLVHFLNYLKEKDGESLFVTEALAQVQITAGDFDAGRGLYLRLLDLDPRSTRTLRALSEIARRAGQAAERRGYLDRLVQVDPNDAPALRELGNLLATEGDLSRALEALRRSLEVQPSEGVSARVAELQAEMLVREAEAEITRLSKGQPTPNTRFRIGELHWKLGRASEAKPFFEEAANSKEHQARALRYLGLIAMAEKNPQDAIALLRGYLAKRTNLAPDPPEKEARYALAEAYDQTEQRELAIQQYEAIFEADPGYKDVARKVKSAMASRGILRGPVDCPFCKRRVPGDAEFCPHCNYQLSGGAPSKYGGSEPVPPPTEATDETFSPESTREGTPSATPVQQIPWKTEDPTGGSGETSG